jgi:hypothetical protein
MRLSLLHLGEPVTGQRPLRFGPGQLEDPLVRRRRLGDPAELVQQIGADRGVRVVVAQAGYVGELVEERESGRGAVAHRDRAGAVEGECAALGDQIVVPLRTRSSPMDTRSLSGCGYERSSFR